MRRLGRVIRDNWRLGSFEANEFLSPIELALVLVTFLAFGASGYNLGDKRADKV